MYFFLTKPEYSYRNKYLKSITNYTTHIREKDYFIVYFDLK